MKKIALVGCYFQHNYGSQLQALALQEFLVSYNFPVEYIDVKQLTDFEKGKRKYYKSKITDFKFIMSKIGMMNLKFKKKFSHSSNVQKMKTRDKKFNEFKHNFYLSKKFNTYEELNVECFDRYSDVIVGSDQLWLPVNVVADFYTLNWVPKEVNKISYSTSFGFNSIPNKYVQQYKNFLSRINHLSVREDKGNELIKDNFGLSVTTVCDPTLLLTRNQWLKLSKGTDRIKEKYIFVYFLGKNKEHWHFVKKLREKTGYKIVSLNHCDEYYKLADKSSDMPLYDVDSFGFVNLIYNAEYICTDSFHGSVFSILNNKKFFTFRRFSDKSKVSTNSRVYSLLKKLNLENHLLKGNETIDDALQIDCDYTYANELIAKYRETSAKWLLGALTYKKNKINRVDELQKRECCGCHGCLNVCPKKCIEMKTDNEGFLYPSIDSSKCVSCGMCVKVCPVNNEQAYSDFKQHGYVVQNKDEKVLKESTSGGAFTAFAKSILSSKGVVYGVKLDDLTFLANHTRVTKEEDLKYFRSSKYVQSAAGFTFSQVKEDLLNDRLVLFSGTICQIEGLLSYLKISKVKTEKLFTIDVICRCVTSPLVLQKYINFQSNKYKQKISWINFRDKTSHGYNWSNLTLYNGETIIYHQGIDIDPYLKLMFKGVSVRPSCFDCCFKHQQRNSDITIWDCFDVANYSNTLNNNKGATKVLINSNKGEWLVSKSLSQLKCIRVSDHELVFNNYEMFNSASVSPKRKDFFNDLPKISENELFAKYTKPTFKEALVNLVKKILIKLNVYSSFKAKKMKGRPND